MSILSSLVTICPAVWHYGGCCLLVTILCARETDQSGWPGRDKLLHYIDGPLQAGSEECFYTLLRIMEQHGTVSTAKLASTMRGCIDMAQFATGGTVG